METLRQLLGETVSFVRNCSQEEKSRNWWVMEKIRCYVEKNYSSFIDIDQLAEEIGLSANYIRYIFKEEKGMTLNHWVTEFRIKKACELLETSQYNVKEVCKMTGYDSASYFCTVFSKYMGMSPDVYRRKNLKW